MSQISEENLKRYTEVFKTMDTNNDESLCKDELEAALQASGYNPTDQEMTDYMSQFDNDGDDKVTFDEFISFMEKVQNKSGAPEDQEAELLEAFQQFDTDGSGYLEPEEVKKLMCDDANEEELQELIKSADTDGDGRISTKELAKLLASFQGI